MSRLTISNPYNDIVLGTQTIRIEGDKRIEESGITTDGTIVKFETNAPGQDKIFYVELYDQGENIRTTPQTVENFLQYVNEGSYNNTIIHRSVRDFVIQGGGFTAPTTAAFSNQIDSNPTAVSTRSTVANEAGNSNTRGTISMAKMANQPDSATSQWFFNLTDNIFLDSSNGGYTVFGNILGSGLSVLDELANAQTYNAAEYYSNSALSELPLWSLNKDSNVQPDDFLKIEFINVVEDYGDSFFHTP